LPGKPDLVFPKYRAVVFVHGCFWHQHDCATFKLPTERRDFWRKKIGGNVVRDEAAVKDLRGQGWRIAIVWECSLRGRNKLGIEATSRLLSTWLRSGADSIEIREKTQ
jgi:DNA mismatch endonuclease (patch repair protein)